MLYVAVATRAFRRYSTYTAATLAGSLHQLGLRRHLLLRLPRRCGRQNPDAGGYDATDAVTFVWIGQALLMTVAVWGGGTTDDLAERIRTGDVAIDLYRPVDLLGWYLAADLGRAAYHLLARGVGAHADRRAALRHPCRRPPAAAARLPGQPGAGRAWSASRSGSWSRAPRSGCSTCPGSVHVQRVLAIFFSGMTLPLVLFPGPARRPIALALPWAAYAPGARRHLAGQARTGVELLGAASAFQAGLGRRPARRLRAVVLRPATRKVVVQGG